MRNVKILPLLPLFGGLAEVIPRLVLLPADDFLELVHFTTFFPFVEVLVEMLAPLQHELQEVVCGRVPENFLDELRLPEEIHPSYGQISAPLDIGDIFL